MRELYWRNLNRVFSQNLGYTVFSTVGAFYLPLAFIVAVYLNVYRVARSRIHRRQFNRRRGDDDRPVPLREASTIDPDIDTTSVGVVWQALRARLNAISRGLCSTLMASLCGQNLVHDLVFEPRRLGTACLKAH